MNFELDFDIIGRGLSYFLLLIILIAAIKILFSDASRTKHNQNDRSI